MFNSLSKKIALFVLIFSINSSSYCMFITKKPKQKMWQKAKEACYNITKNFKKQKCQPAPKGIYRIIAKDTVALLSAFCLDNLLGIGIKYATKHITENLFQDAPKNVQEEKTKLAKLMNIKNPEKIKVKELPFPLNVFIGNCNIAGTICLTKETIEESEAGQRQWVLGHELSHYKHNDDLKWALAGNTCKFGMLYLAKKCNLLNNLKQFNKWTDKFSIYNILAPQKQKLDIPEKKNKAPNNSLWEMTKTNFTQVDATRFLSNVIIGNTLGRSSEKRADLESAALGKDIANGGIRRFKKFKEKESGIFGLFAKLENLFLWKRWITGPHPSDSTRENYLTAFRNAKYGNPKYPLALAIEKHKPFDFKLANKDVE